MFDLDQLLEDARARLDAGTDYRTSDRELSRRLGLTPQAVNLYRKRGVLPKVETAIRLAKMAGHDPEKVVADLLVAQYTGEDPETQKVLRAIRDQIAKGVAAAIVFLIFALPYFGASAEAGTHREQMTPDTGRMYIMGN